MVRRVGERTRIYDNLTKKRKLLRKRGLAVLVIALVIVTIVVSFVWYGLAYGTAIDFTFGGATDVRHSYQLLAMSPLRPPTIDITHILVRNAGNTDITVVVTLHAVNAVVSTSYYGPYSDVANIQIHLPVASGYQFVTFYLTLPVQVPAFTISASLSRVLDFSGFTSLATSSFASVHSTAPTLLTYTKASLNPYDYELTQQS